MARISWKEDPPDVEYVVADEERPIFFETFVLDILEGSHTLCGDLTYDVYYDNNPIPIDSQSTPLRTSVSYSTTLYLKNDDEAVVNTTAPYEIVARLVNYPDRFLARTAMITYLDPCLAPFDIQSSTLYEQAGSYKYTGALFTYTSPEINAVPYFCPVEYECSVLGNTNLPCDSAGITSFDALTHTWTLTLTTDDYLTYPPGNYYFEISGSAGGNVP